MLLPEVFDNDFMGTVKKYIDSAELLLSLEGVQKAMYSFTCIVTKAVKMVESLLPLISE